MDLVRYLAAFLICWFCGPIFLGLIAISQSPTDISDFPVMQACVSCVVPLNWVLFAIVPISMFGELLSEKNKYHPILVFAAVACLFFVILFTFVLAIAFAFRVLDETTLRLAAAYGFTNLIWGSTFWILGRTQRYIFQRMEWVQ